MDIIDFIVYFKCTCLSKYRRKTGGKVKKKKNYEKSQSDSYPLIRFKIQSLINPVTLSGI